MARPVRLRMVKTLCYEANVDLVLKYLLQGNPTQLRLFNAFMTDFAKNISSVPPAAGTGVPYDYPTESNDLIQNDAKEFYENLKKWGIIYSVHSQPATASVGRATNSIFCLLFVRRSSISNLRSNPLSGIRSFQHLLVLGFELFEGSLTLS